MPTATEPDPERSEPPGARDGLAGNVEGPLVEDRRTRYFRVQRETLFGLQVLLEADAPAAAAEEECRIALGEGYGLADYPPLNAGGLRRPPGRIVPDHTPEGP